MFYFALRLRSHQIARFFICKILFVIFSLFLEHEYRTDPRTKKTYIVLEADELAFWKSQSACSSLGMMLPMPRDEGENEFLKDLTSSIFMLNMMYDEATSEWLWMDDDNSSVQWYNWRVNSVALIGKCAIRLGNITNSNSLGKWTDFHCLFPSALKNQFPASKQSIVCEKALDKTGI